MAAPPPPELSGWKDIAAHLGVSVRTAQDYERNFDLPIHRQPGEKGRVYAHPQELDAWRQPTNGSPASEPAEPAGNRSRWSLLISGVAVAAMLAAGAYWRLTPHGPVSDFRVDGKNLTALNDKGQELWRHTFDVPFVAGAYRDEARFLRTWIGDLEGDGRREMIFGICPVNHDDVGTPLVCFAAGGKIRWRFDAGRPVTDGFGNRFVPPFPTNSLHVISNKTPAQTRIAVSSNHYLEYPEQVAFLDVKGTVVGEYWHPGHLLHSGIADLDHDGRTELLLAGVNNGNHQATLVVLDPLQVVGLITPAQMQDRRFELQGMRPARERAVVYFPRSSFSRGQPYTRASFLRITGERVIVDVAEGPQEQNPGFVYELDYALNVVCVTPEVPSMVERYQALEASGAVGHPFSAELARLKAGVIVRRNP